MQAGRGECRIHGCEHRGELVGAARVSLAVDDDVAGRERTTRGCAGTTPLVRRPMQVVEHNYAAEQGQPTDGRVRCRSARLAGDELAPAEVVMPVACKRPGMVRFPPSYDAVEAGTVVAATVMWPPTARTPLCAKPAWSADLELLPLSLSAMSGWGSWSEEIVGALPSQSSAVSDVPMRPKSGDWTRPAPGCPGSRRSSCHRSRCRRSPRFAEPARRPGDAGAVPRMKDPEASADRNHQRGADEARRFAALVMVSARLMSAPPPSWTSVGDAASDSAAS